MARQLLLKNIKQLVTPAAGNVWAAGREMRALRFLENASVLIEDGTIRWLGPAMDLKIPSNDELDVVDASGFVALPGFVDAHTHLVFAGSREDEFALRSEGKTYQEIAQAGGGILSTVRTTRDASKKELKKLASKRLNEMLKQGTTSVEIKSGYGLDPDAEIKILEAIHELENEHYMTVISTFLGAHAVPPEYRGKEDDYVSLVCNHMLPYVAKRKLAAFCDVFCETGYFTVEQSRRVLEQARSLGMKIKIHADELSSSGGSFLAAELRAVSADHLEHIDETGMGKLKDAGVVPVLLPGVSFFLNHSYAPARRLIDVGLPVAIATDFNPGSCMSFSMPLMMTIACTQMHMTPEEALTACTLNAAAALGISDRVGSIEAGKEADIILYDIPNYRYLCYQFGSNSVAVTIKHGTILEF